MRESPLCQFGRTGPYAGFLIPEAQNMTSDHPRNTGPMLASPRCGAKTRDGDGCRSPAVRGRKRCRMHGGAPGSGAPNQNQNAVTHGLFTRRAIEEREQIQAVIKQSRKLLGDLA